jgi:BTB/POZ domain
MMNSPAPNVSEIVSLNLGGEIFLQAHRETLLLPAGSLFAALFSGRWEDHCVKDSEGRVFLDHDPELVRMILNYLKIKRIADPTDPLDPPNVPKEKLKEWFCLLKYYGLKSFFPNPLSMLEDSKPFSSLDSSKTFSSLDVSKIAVIQPTEPTL